LFRGFPEGNQVRNFQSLSVTPAAIAGFIKAAR
jgi:hypothetical protein